jgi:hypothetical protein
VSLSTSSPSGTNTCFLQKTSTSSSQTTNNTSDHGQTQTKEETHGLIIIAINFKHIFITYRSKDIAGLFYAIDWQEIT